MNNQITYFEDYDHLINKGGRKSFFLNYFFFNMIDALSFNKNVIDMLDHSAKCDSYIQAKKQETYNFLSSRQDIDKIISLKEDDPQLNSYEKVFQTIVDNVPHTLVKDVQVNTQAINRHTLVLLHAYFEYHIVDLLDFLFRNKPEMLKTRQKNLSYEQIVDCKNYDAILNAMIKKEIRSYEGKNYLDKRKYIDEKIAPVDDWEYENYGFMINDINELRNNILHNVSDVTIPNEWLWDAQKYLLKLGMGLWLGIKEKYQLDGWLYPFASKRKIK
jgi:hypothetical protein